MISYIFSIFWLFLPAGIANMAPVVANKIPLLNRWSTPLDFKKKFRGKRIFGDNKTWRGLLFGAICGGITAGLQFLVWPSHIERFATPDNPLLFVFGFGFLIGFGALVADSVESFYKRQSNIPAGESWFPFDQLDYVFGGLLMAVIFVELTILDIFAITIIYFLLHITMSYIGYKLKLKDKPI
jgi:CDP-2,3-bis-(O-geranylgeranyl)-sn-glycerol synthase